MTQGNLSSHLSKLEEAEYVNIEKTFKGKYPLTICKLTAKGRNAFRDYARIMRAAMEMPAPAIASKGKKGTSMIGKSQGKTEISPHAARGLP
ncbi:MAG TPA: transcriptional regulator [Candidatus Saccharimonadales bacterium]|nr:transcriptional regulator [Candidatus Saccharimonadales bacterium]